MGITSSNQGLLRFEGQYKPLVMSGSISVPANTYTRVFEVNGNGFVKSITAVASNMASVKITVDGEVVADLKAAANGQVTGMFEKSDYISAIASGYGSSGLRRPGTIMTSATFPNTFSPYPTIGGTLPILLAAPVYFRQNLKVEVTSDVGQAVTYEVMGGVA